jgi:peptidoglycan/LPS O-acetylase OafA/YrhL
MGDQLPRRAAGVAGNHLWFLYVLTLLYAAVLPVRWLVRSTLDTGGRLRATIDVGLRAVVRGPWAAFVLSVPLAIAFLSSTWRLWYGIPSPNQSLIPNLPAGVAFSVAFLAGWLLHRQAALLAGIERQWAVQLGLASALTVVCLWIVGVTRSGETAAFDLRTAVYGVLYAAAGWAWTLALIGIALRFFAAESPVRRYVSDASYWIYLAHLPVLIVLQAAMKDLPFHWAIKFPVQLVVALAFLFATYHWLVRFTFVGEVLNGTRYRRSRGHETPAQPAPRVADAGTAPPLAQLRPALGALGRGSARLQVRATSSCIQACAVSPLPSAISPWPNGSSLRTALLTWLTGSTQKKSRPGGV